MPCGVGAPLGMFAEGSWPRARKALAGGVERVYS